MQKKKSQNFGHLFAKKYRKNLTLAEAVTLAPPPVQNPEKIYENIWKCMKMLRLKIEGILGIAQISCRELRQGTTVLRNFQLCGVDLAERRPSTTQGLIHRWSIFEVN